MLDPAFLQDGPSDRERRKQIVQDLQVAAGSGELRKVIRATPILKKWMALNDIREKDIKRE
jgi:hypothetical protein